MATLFNRNGRFYVNYTLHGRRVRKSLGTNERDAELYFRELQYRLFRGDIRPPRPQIPIDYLIDRYLQNCDGRIAPSTVIRYRSALHYFREFITVYSPVQFVDQVTRIMLQEYVDFRLNKPKRPKGNTVNQELTIIRAMFNFAVDSEYIEINPARRIKMLKTNDAKKGQVLSQDEITAMMEGCNGIKDGQWFKDILTVFLNTGMRLGELLNLTWMDIDSDQQVIKIQEKPFWSPKTYERDIPINQKTNHQYTQVPPKCG